MEEEWIIVKKRSRFYLYWGKMQTARFDDDVAVEEMESIVEKLNEGTPFDGFAKVVPA